MLTMFDWGIFYMDDNGEQGRTSESSTLDSLFKKRCGAAIGVIRRVS